MSLPGEALRGRGKRQYVRVWDNLAALTLEERKEYDAKMAAYQERQNSSRFPIMWYTVHSTT